MRTGIFIPVSIVYLKHSINAFMVFQGLSTHTSMHLHEHQHTPLNVHVHVKPSAKPIDPQL